jgi:hypothetical protein
MVILKEKQGLTSLFATTSGRLPKNGNGNLKEWYNLDKTERKIT